MPVKNQIRILLEAIIILGKHYRLEHYKINHPKQNANDEVRDQLS